MADYSIYQIAIGETGTTYPQKYDNFVLISKARAEEVEDARAVSYTHLTLPTTPYV